MSIAAEGFFFYVFGCQGGNAAGYMDDIANMPNDELLQFAVENGMLNVAQV